MDVRAPVGLRSEGCCATCAARSPLMTGFLIVVGSLTLGALLRRWLPAGLPDLLNSWVLRVALPALVLAKIPLMEVRLELAAPALAPWALFVGSALLMPLAGRRFGWSRGTVGCLVLTSGLGNTAFVGLPLIGALRGPDALGPALVVDQLGSSIILATAGAVVAATYAGGGADPKAILGRLARFPPLLALIGAVIVRNVGAFPGPVLQVLELLALTLTPVALFVVGVRFRAGSARALASKLGVGLGWSLLLAPLLIALVLRLTGITGVAADVAVLQVAMPPMVTASIVASDHDLDPELGTAMVGVGLLVSLLSIPLWHLLLQLVA